MRSGSTRAGAIAAPAPGDVSRLRVHGPLFAARARAPAHPAPEARRRRTGPRGSRSAARRRDPRCVRLSRAKAERWRRHPPVEVAAVEDVVAARPAACGARGRSRAAAGPPARPRSRAGRASATAPAAGSDGGWARRAAGTARRRARCRRDRPGSPPGGAGRRRGGRSGPPGSGRRAASTTSASAPKRAHHVRCAPPGRSRQPNTPAPAKIASERGRSAGRSA